MTVDIALIVAILGLAAAVYLRRRRPKSRPNLRLIPLCTCARCFDVHEPRHG